MAQDGLKLDILAKDGLETPASISPVLELEVYAGLYGTDGTRVVWLQTSTLSAELHPKPYAILFTESKIPLNKETGDTCL